MQRVCKTWFPRLSTILLCCFSVSLPVLAAPPAGKSAPPGASAGPRSPHLDLRAPTPIDAWLPKTTAVAGMRRGMIVRDDGYSSNDRHLFPMFDSASRQPALVRRAAAIAQRFRHEGLPVARLWENHAAFISLGLNGRGKPGLWLVQKIH